MHYTLGLASGSRGIEHKERVLTVQRLRGTAGRLLAHCLGRQGGEDEEEEGKRDKEEVEAERVHI